MVWSLIKTLFKKKAVPTMPRKLSKSELDKARLDLLKTVNEGADELSDASKPFGFWKNAWCSAANVGELYLRVNARKRYLQIGSVNIEKRLRSHGLFKAVLTLLVLKTDREMERMFNLIKIENIYNPQLVCNFLNQFENDWLILHRELGGARNIFLLRKGHEDEYTQADLN